MRKFFYAIAVLSTLVVVAIVFLPHFVDLNDYKREIAAQIKSSTGRDVSIDGAIELAILPSPRIAVSGVTIASPEGALAPEMLSLDAAEMRIAFLPLLRGALQIDSITLIGAVVEVERFSDGRLNWSAGDGREGTADGAGGSSSMGGSVRLARVVVHDGTLVWRDHASGAVERIENIALEAEAVSLDGPFRSTGSLMVRGLPMTFQAEVGSLVRGAVPMTLGVALDGEAAVAQFSGSLVRRPEGARATGRLEAEGPALAAAIEALSPGAGAGLPGGPFSLSGVAAITASDLTLDELAVDLGGLTAQGTLRARFEGTPRIEATLVSNRLDLDQYLSAARAPGTAGPATGAGGAPAAAGFALPDGMDAALDIAIDALVYRGAIVRQARLVARLEGGAARIETLSALLPGGSDVAIDGEVAAVGGAPRFDGRIEATSDNLRAVLAWLEVPLPDVPADRLRNMSLLTRLTLTPELAMISDLDLRLDVSRLSGGVNLSLNSRPAFNAILELDRLNLDSYLPPPAGGKADDGAGAPVAGESPLLALAGLNGELKARIGRLVYGAIPANGIEIDAGLRGGAVTLRGLSVNEVAGMRLAANGAYDAAAQSFDIEYTGTTADLGAVLRGIEAPYVAPNAGEASFSGRIGGGLAQVSFDATISAMAATGGFSGEIETPMLQPSGGIIAEVSGGDLAETLRRAGLDGDFGVPVADAGFVAAGTFEIDGARTDVSVRLDALGGGLRADGVVNLGVDGVGYDLAAIADHPDLAALTGGRMAPGALHLEGRLAGGAEQLRLSALSGTVGQTEIREGEIEARFDGVRPFVEADLVAGHLSAALFAPVATGGFGGGRGGARESPVPEGRWSREPLRLDGLAAFDGRARLRADSLDLPPHRFEEVGLELALADGALDVERLAGRAYDGQADLTARLVATGTPTVEVDIRIAGADLRALLLNAADVGELSGRLDLTGSFFTEGRSEAELVSAISGTGDLSVRDGSVDGIDLARLDRQLDDIESEGDVVRLVADALAGGETGLRSLTGRFEATGGVLRSDDLHADLDGAEGTGTAVIDLPRWRLRLDSDFRLASHAKAPPLRLILDGPVDAPRRKIRDKELRAYVVQRMAGKAIEKIAPGTGVGEILETIIGGPTTPQAAPAEGGEKSAGTTPKNDNPPEVPFKNLLEGILKDLNPN